MFSVSMRTLGLVVSLIIHTIKAQYGHVIIPSKSSPNERIKIQTENIYLQGQQAYLAIITGSIPQSYFHVLVKDSECSLEKTSLFARNFQCQYAINAGPFHSYTKGGCVGFTVSNGTIIHETRDEDNGTPVSTDEDAGFGITDDNEWILGSVNSMMLQQKQKAELNIQEFVTGLNAGWLIYNSTNVISNQDSQDRAPRTAIGVDSDGQRLVILQVDGCEHCILKTTSRSRIGRGLTLHEMAEAMKGYVDFAINLDGGGSSTSVCNEIIINHPTCLDYVTYMCERPVASAICIRDTGLVDSSEINNGESINSNAVED